MDFLASKTVGKKKKSLLLKPPSLWNSVTADKLNKTDVKIKDKFQNPSRRKREEKEKEKTPPPKMCSQMLPPCKIQEHDT